MDPDERLKPEMNANVAFYARPVEARPVTARKQSFTPPANAVRGNAVFIVVEGKAVRRAPSELVGGDELIVNPTPDIRDETRVRIRTDR
ncbi:MAG TPA: hypothetical protein VG297_16700 [Bryobacteraceae bacterium]|jgi:hypothetical protein|nr:hypothetical protein [Bryobacteraceae bacterium]